MDPSQKVCLCVCVFPARRLVYSCILHCACTFHVEEKAVFRSRNSAAERQFALAVALAQREQVKSL